MRIKGWRSEVALADIVGYVVVTRCTDPANNTDKYRRFITLTAPSENHLHIQHTGRWTAKTNQDRWIEGVWRPQGTAKLHTQTRFPATDSYNEEMVRRKLGDYKVVQRSRLLTSSEIKDIIDRAKLIDDNPALPAATLPPTTPAPATRPISGQPSKQASTPVQANKRLVTNGELSDMLDKLLARANGSEDPFDLLVDLTPLKRQVKWVLDEARQLEDQLKLTTEAIMTKAGV